MRSIGWNHAYAYIVETNRHSVAFARYVPITTPGSSVNIEAPSRTVYAALSITISQSDADQQTDGSPI